MALWTRLKAVKRTSNDCEKISRNLGSALKLMSFDILARECGQDRGILRHGKAGECSFNILARISSRARFSDSNPFTVSDDFPVIFNQDASFVLRLKVRLVEARVNNVAVIRLKFSVDVLGAITLVLEVLETLTVRHVE